MHWQVPRDMSFKTGSPWQINVSKGLNLRHRIRYRHGRTLKSVSGEHCVGEFDLLSRVGIARFNPKPVYLSPGQACAGHHLGHRVPCLCS